MTNLIKGIYKKSTANIILNCEDQIISPLRSLTRQGCPPSPVLLNIVPETVANVLRPKKEIKGIYMGKKEAKLSLHSDDMIVYVENMIECTKKLLELIIEFGKFAGYKINIKLIIFLCTSKEQKSRK